jgi:hypothetical protein
MLPEKDSGELFPYHLSFQAASRVLIWAILAGGAVIELLLAVRVWAQVTGRPVADGLLGLVFDLSGRLVGPFSGFEPSARTIKSTGILEISTLVAMEAYLLATIAAVVLVLLVRSLVGAIQRAREASSARSQIPA